MICCFVVSQGAWDRIQFAHGKRRNWRATHTPHAPTLSLSLSPPPPPPSLSLLLRVVRCPALPLTEHTQPPCSYRLRSSPRAQQSALGSRSSSRCKRKERTTRNRVLLRRVSACVVIRVQPQDRTTAVHFALHSFLVDRATTQDRAPLSLSPPSPSPTSPPSTHSLIRVA
jgi:hypothetical protein